MSKKYLIVDSETAEVVRESRNAPSVLMLRELHRLVAAYIVSEKKADLEAVKSKMKQITPFLAEWYQTEEK